MLDPVLPGFQAIGCEALEAGTVENLPMVIHITIPGPKLLAGADQVIVPVDITFRTVFAGFFHEISSFWWVL